MTGQELSKTIWFILSVWEVKFYGHDMGPGTFIHIFITIITSDESLAAENKATVLLWTTLGGAEIGSSLEPVN